MVVLRGGVPRPASNRAGTLLVESWLALGVSVRCCCSLGVAGNREYSFRRSLSEVRDTFEDRLFVFHF